MNNQKIKADKGKPRVSLTPSAIVRCIAYIRAYGMDKYPDGGKDNWKAVEPERYIDAMYRHLLAFVDDPYSRDEESGLPHLWHLACNAAFLCELLPMDKTADGEVIEEKPNDCVFCKYVRVSTHAEPCKSCRNNYMNLWEKD